jgi:hypothetical protein
MTIRNRFPATCRVCGKPVDVGAGAYVKGQGVTHPRCLSARPATRGENLASTVARHDREAHARELAAEHDAKNPFTR